MAKAMGKFSSSFSCSWLLFCLRLLLIAPMPDNDDVDDKKIKIKLKTNVLFFNVAQVSKFVNTPKNEVLKIIKHYKTFISQVLNYIISSMTTRY